MRIAFAGKRGSDKTTLSSLFIRHLAGQGLPLIAIDDDIGVACYHSNTVRQSARSVLRWAQPAGAMKPPRSAWIRSS